MPSFVVHLVVPPLALLSLRTFDPRLVALLLPLSLLPDLDFFVGVHRAMLHNVFVLIPFLLVAWRWWGDPLRSKLAQASFLAFAYLGSHQLMDTFVGGVVPLWPVSNTTLLLDVLVLVDTKTLDREVVFEPASHEGAPIVSPVYEWLNGTEFAILLVGAAVGGFFLGRAAWRWWEARRATGFLSKERDNRPPELK